MNNDISLLAKQSDIEIVQYGIDENKRTLNNINRRFSCYIISYIKKGSCRLVIGDENICASKGDILVIPPDTFHSHIKDSLDETTFVWFHFNYKYCSTIDVLSLFDLPICSHIDDDGVLENALEDYMRLDKKDDTNLVQEIYKKAKALELIGHLIDSLFKVNNIKANKKAGVFVEIFALLSSSLEKPLTLDKIARKYNMHPTYLSNKFKRLYGITPIQLRMQFKVQKAKNLLLRNEMSVGEIGFSLGFSEIGEFTRFFKKKVGVSPIEFKKNKL